VSGTSGLSGTSGVNGTSGTDGASGTSGVSGTSGTSGAAGAAGTSGVNGTSGTSGVSPTLSGTTNTVAKFTSASAIGNSNITDSGSLITLGSNTTISSGSLGIGTSSLTAFNLRILKNITGSATSYGIMVESTIQSDVTDFAYIYRSAPDTQAAAFTLSQLSHFTASQGTIGAGSTVSTQQGFYAGPSLIGATSNYGFRGSISTGTNRWNLYMDGTANNYLNGALGIGSTSLTAFNLRVSKAITGGVTAYGINSDGQIQSDVTTSAFYYRSNASTQATTFTLSNLYHYTATQSTIGAGSTVTSQTGFFVSSSLIGATNNYGFYGSIPAQANAWNLYMSGTAQNYLAGNLGIGSGRTVPAYAVDVTGDVNVTGSFRVNGTALSSGVSGSGTTGNIPKFTGTTSIGNSIMSESGSVITISGTLTETSALKYKENIKTIDGALDSVLKMRGVTYNKIGNDYREMGVIAEEVYKVAPELIKFENDEIDSVAYARTVGLLIEAIKEQQKQIDELKSLLGK
jgi:hypothetical protein